MSNENKTQLQTNNTALASLTDRVLAAKDTAAALPDAGSGGASVGSVTINLPVSNNQVIALCLVDGNIVTVDLSGNSSYTIDNVLVGSMVFVYIYETIPYTNIVTVGDIAKQTFNVFYNNTGYYYTSIITGTNPSTITYSQGGGGGLEPPLM